MKLKTYTPQQIIGMAGVMLIGGVAHGATISSTAAGFWMDAATWGGAAPIAGNIYVADHELKGSTTDFAGDELVISGTGSLRRDLAGQTDWNMNDLTIQSGGRVMSASSNRQSNFNGGTLTLEDGAILRTPGRTVRFQFDTWTVSSSATVTLDAFNAEAEFRDGPGAGTTDMSGFQGTLSVTNTQGKTMPDLEIYFDILEADAAIQLLLKDIDLNANGIDLDTHYELQNGRTQWFASVDAHQVVLTVDIDGDGRYDPGDGDVLTTTDVSLAPGLYTKAQLDALGTGIGDSFFDQGAGTGQIGVAQIAVAVPEPSSTALLGLAGFALILRRRK